MNVGAALAAFVATLTLVTPACRRTEPQAIAPAPESADAAAPSSSQHHVRKHQLACMIPSPRTERFEDAPQRDVSLAELTELGKAAIADYDAKLPADDVAHTQWFFSEFDDRSLTFVLADYRPSPPPPGKLGSHGTYVARERLRTARTPDAVDAFPGVRLEIEQWEIGVGGVRVGMTRAEVIARLGPPLRVEPTQLFACNRLVYHDVTAFLAFEDVISVQAAAP